VKGVELSFTPERELLIRSPGLSRSTTRNPQATAESKDAQGWFHTGDAGYVDADGHLKIIDRVKDVGKLADGSLFAPKYLENKLKFFPYIKEAVAFGHQRDRVCAFVNMDMEAVGNWAEKRGLPYAGYVDLASRDEVYDLVRDCVERVNADLAADPELAGSQIHRFLILHKQLEADDGELTRTAKVRRATSARNMRRWVDALYGGRQVIHVEAQVRYEDGRTGSISADLKIRDAKGVPGGGPRRRRPDQHAGRGARGPHRRGDPRAWTGCRSPSAASKALSDVSFDVREHEVRAIIGPNGAGKSSMLNVINGVYHPQQGTIRYLGREYHDMDPHEVAVSGISRTFQNLTLFKGMSVLDNIMSGAQPEDAFQHLLQALRIGPALREEIAHREVVEGHHRFPGDTGLSQDAGRHVALRPAEARRSSRARWPMEPRVLLLDEPGGRHEHRGESRTCAASSST
jgi:ABC-type nitrate/sulfonate/bicarbonate transport system ATPase subunit